MPVDDNDRRYLKPAFVAEPLVDRWYAWSHLVAPATAAMNIANRHLPIMESYAKEPAVHAAAAANPQLLGGPFIDYPDNRVEDIQRLIAWTRDRRGPLLELHQAICKLDQLLREKAKGGALDALYAEVPAPLRGYVELVYDLNDNPSFRLIEPLFYRSRYHDPSTQSLMLAVREGTHRPFALSTPRLDCEGDLHLRTPFARAEVDDLLRMRTEPHTLGWIRERLGLEDHEVAALTRMTTDRAPDRHEPYTGPGGRWRYFGHACILFETGNCSILVDPMFAHARTRDWEGYTYDDLPAVIDYVLITHNHQDHILLEALLQLRHRVRQIIVPRSRDGALQDPSLRWVLKSMGFDNVVELSEFGEIELDGGSITGLPFFGEHSDLDIRSRLIYRIELGGRRVVIGVDACNVEQQAYRLIAECIGPIDTLLLGMECEGAPLSWLYGPLLTRRIDRKADRARTLSGSDYARAKAMVDAFRPAEVYVYAMGMETWCSYILAKSYTEASRPMVDSRRLVEACSGDGRRSARLGGRYECRF